MSEIGYAPALLAVDGLWGCRPRAPYDRIVAACSVTRIPDAWLDQLAPGGKLLTTVAGWMYGYGRVLIDITDGSVAYTRDGTAFQAGPERLWETR
jgi:protein-L-isoaspartate O-methyltransferase